MSSKRQKLLRKIQRRAEPPQIIDIPHAWDRDFIEDEFEYVEALHEAGFKNVRSVKHINMTTRESFIRIQIEESKASIVRASTSKR